MKKLLTMIGAAARTLTSIFAALFACVALADATWTGADGSTYTALEYLQGNGNGYVVTDITPLCTDTVKMRFTTPSSLPLLQALFCARVNNKSRLFAGFMDGGNSKKLRIDRNTKQVRSSEFVFAEDSEYSMEVDFNNQTVKINGASITISPESGDYTVGSTLALFAIWNGSTATTDYKGQHTLYYFELYDSSGTLKYCFLPAKNASDKAGLYDTVHGVFYPQDGNDFGTAARGVTGSGKKWTGRGSDNKMSTAANWEGSSLPAVGDDLDFTLAPPLATIDADISGNYGKLWLDNGDVPNFIGSINVSDCNYREKVAGNSSVIFPAGDYTVYSGTTLSVSGTTLENPVVFESGSTLDVASYTPGVIPLSAPSVTLPADGTVALTLNGGTFARGVYAICEASGLTAADGVKFSVSAGELAVNWSILNGRLVLSVGVIGDNYWTGLGGDRKISTAANWANNAGAPATGGAVDFSGIATDMTIDADVERTFGAVTMGTGVITFTNSFAASSFSDYSKLAVGADSTVTIDNSLTFSGNANTRLCYTVEESGELRVTGSLSIATSEDFHFAAKATFDAAAGAIVVEGGITINTSNYTVLNAGKLVLGANGVSIPTGRLCILSNASFYSLGAETILSGRYDIYNDCLLTFCTTQYGIELPATITFAGSLLQRGNYYGSAMVAGCGMAVFPSSATATRNVSVDDGATLAVSTGAVFSVTTSDTTSTVNSGGTIEVSESGVFTVSSKFTLADGACLGFNFTDKAVAPSLAVASGKTVTIGSTVNVKISASDDIRPKGGTYTLTGGMDFTGKTVNIVDRPDWVQSVEIDASGNLVAMVKHNGLIIFCR